jgi:hypothetical protein
MDLVKRRVSTVLRANTRRLSPQSLRPHASSALWASIQALMEQRLRMLAFSVLMANYQKWAVSPRATVSVSALQVFTGNLELALLATWANIKIHQSVQQAPTLLLFIVLHNRLEYCEYILTLCSFLCASSYLLCPVFPFSLLLRFFGTSRLSSQLLH